MVHILSMHIAELYEMCLDMMKKIDKSYQNFTFMYTEKNLDYMDKVLARENKINALENKLDAKTQEIFALYNPKAMDLRIVITAIKIDVDLERIGDLIESSVHDLPLLLEEERKNLSLGANSFLKDKTERMRNKLEMMLQQVAQMLQKAIHSFQERDVNQAKETILFDQEIDFLYKEINQESMQALLRQSKIEEPLGILAYYLMIAKNLERIADHFKNIAEKVIFIQEGVDVSHHYGRIFEEGNSDQDPKNA